MLHAPIIIIINFFFQLDHLTNFQWEINLNFYQWSILNKNTHLKHFSILNYWALHLEFNANLINNKLDFY